MQILEKEMGKFYIEKFLKLFDKLNDIAILYIIIKP